MKKILTNLILGASMLLPISANSETYTRHLDSGWNYISIPYETGSMSVPQVFNSIGSNLIIINGFDNGAKTYDPLLPEFSDLSKIVPELGYEVKVTNPIDLVLDNVGKADRGFVHFNKGWNLAGYLFDNPKTPQDFFGNEIEHVIVVNGFDNGAKTYDPSLPEFSDLFILTSWKGYMIMSNLDNIYLIVNNKTCLGKFIGNTSDLSVNISSHWNNLSNINTTQMQDNGGNLNILVSWLTSLFYQKSEIYNKSEVDNNLTVGSSNWKTTGNLSVHDLNVTGIMNVTENITLVKNGTICYNPTCSAYEYWNGTVLIRKVS